MDVYNLDDQGSTTNAVASVEWTYSLNGQDGSDSDSATDNYGGPGTVGAVIYTYNRVKSVSIFVWRSDYCPAPYQYNNCNGRYQVWARADILW